MTALHAKNLSCNIGRHPILENISVDLKEGARLAIIGPNGAGKTTLLRCIAGIQTSTGDLAIFGKTLKDYRRRELATLLSFVPQPDATYLPFSVFEFVLMGRYPHLSPFASISPEDKSVTRHALEMTDTQVFAERNMDTLSGGERQRVFIAAALAQGARMLLLDEPTAFLDYRYRGEIQRLLSRLNRENGLTIVTVTHDAGAAAFESDAVLALKNGKAIFSGAPEALLEGDLLESIYDTKFRIVNDDSGNAPLVAPIGPAK